MPGEIERAKRLAAGEIEHVRRLAAPVDWMAQSRCNVLKPPPGMEDDTDDEHEKKHVKHVRWKDEEESSGINAVTGQASYRVQDVIDKATDFKRPTGEPRTRPLPPPATPPPPRKGEFPACLRAVLRELLLL